MTIIFPDIEPIIVSYLQDSLPAYGYGTTSVATKKPAPDATTPSSSIVVTGAYQATLDHVRREASAILDIYATDYATASELASLVAALMPDILGAEFKKSDVALGPVRQADEGPQEKRSLSVDFIVKGITL
jgi:hypothetical protein